MSEERPLDRRPAARPVQPPAVPGQTNPPEQVVPPKEGMGCFGIGCLSIVIVIVIIIIGAIITTAVNGASSGPGGTSGGGSKLDLETQCRQAVADHLDIAVEDVIVTWNNETPGGSLDWRGEYGAGVGGEYGNPGTFACGASLNPPELTQVIVITENGTAEVAVL